MVDRPASTQALPFRVSTMSLARRSRGRSSYHVAQGLELVDKLPHGMWVCLKRMGNLGNREVPLRLLSRPPVLTVSDFYSYRLR